MKEKKILGLGARFSSVSRCRKSSICWRPRLPSRKGGIKGMLKLRLFKEKTSLRQRGQPECLAGIFSSEREREEGRLLLGLLRVVVLLRGKEIRQS